MDSKSTQNQSVVSVSTGPIYTSDFYGRFKSSEQKEVLLKLGVNLDIQTGASKAGSEAVAQTGFLLSPSGQNYNQELLLHPESSLYGSKLLHRSTSPSSSSSSSSQCGSPPSSPTFTSVSFSPSNSPSYLFMSCPLPVPSDSLSPHIAPLSLHRPVIVHQPILPNMARDFTPPQSPVLALRPESFSIPTQSIWRPWSWALTIVGISLLLRHCSNGEMTSQRDLMDVWLCYKCKVVTYVCVQLVLFLSCFQWLVLLPWLFIVFDQCLSSLVSVIFIFGIKSVLSVLVFI